MPLLPPPQHPQRRTVIIQIVGFIGLPVVLIFGMLACILLSR